MKWSGSPTRGGSDSASGSCLFAISHFALRRFPAMLQSSGTLLYRRNGAVLEVLLVHPAGGYNRHKPWGIPKGLADEGESLEAAARRETLEEAGITAGE